MFQTRENPKRNQMGRLTADMGTNLGTLDTKLGTLGTNMRASGTAWTLKVAKRG